jgi:hypothetical protein
MDDLAILSEFAVEYANWQRGYVRTDYGQRME